MTALPTMLQPSIVNERISRLKVINDTFQRAFGFQKSGANVRRQDTRRGSYDIFDQTRRVASGTLPGVSATNVARFPVGNVPFNIPRHAEKINIPMEEVTNIRRVGGPTNGIDTGGEQYIMDQEANQKQSVTNLREFQCAAMLRGSYGWTPSGSSGFTHVFSGGTYTINYQIPAGNLSQLNMVSGGDIIGTSWNNAAAPIVRDILQINQAFTELVGLGLTDIWVNSTVWGHIIVNTEVGNLAGNVNNPIQNMVRNEERNEFTATLNAIPWVTFHITDNGLDVNGSFTRLLGDTQATFMCRFDSFIANYYECPEPVVNPVTNAMSMEYGEYYYHRLCSDPVSYEFYSIMNGLPALKVPKAIATGTVVF